MNRDTIQCDTDEIDQIQARATRLIAFSITAGALCMALALAAAEQNRRGVDDGYLLGWQAATAHLDTAPQRSNP